MLYIFNYTEDGMNCHMVNRHNFDAWMREHTEDIKPECYPVFMDHPPTYIHSSNMYFIIEGEILMPQAREVVKTYVLPDRH